MEQWAADIAAPGEQLGVRCLTQGSQPSHGHFLPEPGFKPTTLGYPRFQVIEPRLYPLGHDCPSRAPVVLPCMPLFSTNNTTGWSAHTQQWVENKHTHPEQRAAILYAAASGEQLGVRCLAQGSHLSRGIEGEESAVHSLHPPTTPVGPETRTCDLWVTKSDSLSIRPRLPPSN